MSELISCVVPVYNGQRFLGEALDSIFAQTYRPIEVIVVDDGSTDGTANVAARYGQPIRYIRQENRGASVARNAGIHAAAGEFIAFLDADDLWTAQKLTAQMARFAARPELDVCVAHVQNFWMDEMADERARLGDHPRTRPMPGYVSGTLLARRRLFDAVGLFNEKNRHCDAAEFFLRVRQHGGVEELLGDVLLRRRMHRDNVSHHASKPSTDEFLSLLKRKLDRQRDSR
jgi:glycosyltransferase involved in cell wall biosynthesis